MGSVLVILDTGGVLRDVVEANYISFRDAFRQMGLPWNLSYEEFRERRCRAMSSRELLRQLVPEGMVERLYAKREEIYHSLKIPLFPFSEESLRILSDRHTLALLSNTTRERNEKDLGALLRYFDVIITRENLTSKKPSPEGILKILELTSYQRGEAVFVGDMVLDILAAKNAGVEFIGVLSGFCGAHVFDEFNVKYFENVLDVAQHLTKF